MRLVQVVAWPGIHTVHMWTYVITDMVHACGWQVKYEPYMKKRESTNCLFIYLFISVHFCIICIIMEPVGFAEKGH